MKHHINEASRASAMTRAGRNVVLFFCLCLSGTDANRQPQARRVDLSAVEETPLATQSKPSGVSLKGALTQLAAFEESTVAEVSIYGLLRPRCGFMLFFLVFLCCCQPVIRAALGDALGMIFHLASTFGLLFYIYFSGIYDMWSKGVPLSTSCQILCWWVFFCLLFAAIWCACTCCLGATMFGAAFVIKNELIKKMHEEYEQKSQDLSGPRKAYFESDVFKERCDTLFDTYDKDGNGTLCMEEMQPLILAHVGHENAKNATIQTALTNGGTVQKAEFVYFMQFLSVLNFQEGHFTEESAWEVLQLNPDTATYDDVKRSYKKLSMKYHPDKRRDAPEDVVKRDMAEVNDAKALLDKKFAPQK